MKKPTLKSLIQSVALAAALLSHPAQGQEVKPPPTDNQIKQLTTNPRVNMAFNLDYAAGFAGFKYNSKTDQWNIGNQVFSAGLEVSNKPYYIFLDSSFSTAKKVKGSYLDSDILDNRLSLGAGYHWDRFQSDLGLLLTKKAESLLAGGTIRAKGTLDMYIGYLKDMVWEAKLGLAGKNPHLALTSEFNFINRYFLDAELKIFKEEQDYEIGPALGNDWGLFSAKLALNYDYKTFKDGAEHSLITKLSLSASQLP